MSAVPRRVVTGHDASGRSVVLSDAPTPKTLDIGTAAFHELWITDRDAGGDRGHRAGADRPPRADAAARRRAWSSASPRWRPAPSRRCTAPRRSTSASCSRARRGSCSTTGPRRGWAWATRSSSAGRTTLGEPVRSPRADGVRADRRHDRPTSCGRRRGHSSSSTRCSGSERQRRAPRAAAASRRLDRGQRLEEARRDRRGDRAARAPVLDEDGDGEVAAEGDEPGVRRRRVAAAVLGGPALAGDLAGHRRERRAGARGHHAAHERAQGRRARPGRAPGRSGAGRSRPGAARASARRRRSPRRRPWPAGWRRCGPGRSSSPRARPRRGRPGTWLALVRPRPKSRAVRVSASGARRLASETKAVLHDCAKSRREGHRAGGLALEVLEHLAARR